jgi:hypothetical protein
MDLQDARPFGDGDGASDSVIQVNAELPALS